MDEKLEPVSERKSAVYELLRFLAKIVFHTVMPVTCHNRERLDAEAPYVLIANHRHALDPVAMAMFIPHRQICFLAKKELGSNKLANRLLTSAHVIFVGRGDTDMAAMRSCMKAIRMKKILLIVPVYIDREMSFFRRTHLYVGEPIPCEDLKARGINTETCGEMNDRFRETFRRLMAGAEGTSQKN